MTAPLVLTIVHYAVCSVGILANSLLLILIVTSTPRNMRSYAIIVFVSSSIELITDIASFFLFMRIFPIDETIIFTPFGFFSVLESANLCFAIYSIMFWGHSFYCIFLAFCFCYRLYIIIYDIPRTQSLMACIIVVILPSTIIYVFFSQSSLIGPNILSGLVAKAGLDKEDLNFAFVSVFDPRVFAGLFWITAPFGPCYFIILWIGYRLIKILSSESNHMSARSKRAHREIVKMIGLILQSCLPVVDCISIGAYFFMEMELINYAPLGFTTHMCGEVVISTNPLISLYSIRPYRELVLQQRRYVMSASFRRLTRLLKKGKEVQVETTMSLSNVELPKEKKVQLYRV